MHGLSKELRPANGAIRGCLKALGQRHRWLLLPGKHTPDPGVGVAFDLPLDLGDGLGQPRAQIGHGQVCIQKTDYATKNTIPLRNIVLRLLTWIDGLSETI